jgi:hypothetical protein
VTGGDEGKGGVKERRVGERMEIGGGDEAGEGGWAGERDSCEIACCRVTQRRPLWSRQARAGQWISEEEWKVTRSRGISVRSCIARPIDIEERTNLSPAVQRK